MSASEATLHPLAALAVAEREFDAGNYVASSRILWQATESTYAMMAEALGLDAGNLIAVADALDHRYRIDHPTRPHHYNGYLITGKLLRDHAAMGVLEDYELEGPHRRLPPFIRECFQKYGKHDAE